MNSKIRENCEYPTNTYSHKQKFAQKYNKMKTTPQFILFILVCLFLCNIFGCQNSNAKQLTQKTYKTENNKLKKEVIEDRNYYDIICDNCKNHPEKIEQNIRDGGDKKW